MSINPPLPRRAALNLALALALARIFHERQVGGLVPKRVFIGS